MSMDTTTTVAMEIHSESISTPSSSSSSQSMCIDTIDVCMDDVASDDHCNDPEQQKSVMFGKSSKSV